MYIFKYTYGGKAALDKNEKVRMIDIRIIFPTICNIRLLQPLS